MLALLAEGPKYGLQLRQEFESRTGDVWPLNVGQVYLTLQRLERDELIESDGEGKEGPQKAYRITRRGHRELTAWLRTPPDLTTPPRDELVIKVLVALRLPGIDVTELLQVHRRSVVELMQRYTYVKAEAAPDDLSLALVADAELFRLEATVRWLDATDARLRQLGTDAQTAGYAASEPATALASTHEPDQPAPSRPDQPAPSQPDQPVPTRAETSR
jgi:DNA-binding PadR family transcriptional regulator